tara:strand:+ start:325 stop:531 length:207 start_codon:yes stop_codon:yes gene_type:complete
MAAKSSPPLPLPETDYQLDNELVTRRTIEQIIQDIFNDLANVDTLRTAALSKSIKRHQFLLMGTKGNV